MKKALSVLLALTMILTSAIFMASAAFGPNFRPKQTCTCPDHNEDGPCHCCIYCNNLDTAYLLDCCKTPYQGDNQTKDYKFCCSQCSGLVYGGKNGGCGCECDCCIHTPGIPEDDDPSLIPPSAQDKIVTSFQESMAKVKKVFDDLFQRIFDFLKIFEIIGKRP